jgi:AraC-like DNA-binding protein
MPNSAVLKLTDPYEYQAAIRDAEDLKCIVTARGDYRAELTLVSLHQLELQRGSISLPRIVSSAHTNEQCNFCFPTADQPSVLFNGVEVTQSSIGFYAPGAEYFVRASGECLWAGITVPPETLASAAKALLGYEITTPAATQLRYSSPALMQRLLDLHKAATLFAETVPDLLAWPEVSRAIEQQLLRALITCLRASPAITDRRVNKQKIMRQFHEVIDANPNEPLYVGEICRAVRVSERTLSRICIEYLGMGPHKYLWLRRMNMVRRTMIRAEAAETTVTAIAMDHGFGELGRFSVQYRQLYGEMPSRTLRRPPP